MMNIYPICIKQKFYYCFSLWHVDENNSFCTRFLRAKNIKSWSCRCMLCHWFFFNVLFNHQTYVSLHNWDQCKLDKDWYWNLSTIHRQEGKRTETFNDHFLGTFNFFACNHRYEKSCDSVCSFRVVTNLVQNHDHKPLVFLLRKSV